MKGILIRVSDSKKFVTFLFKIENGTYGRTFSGKQYRNFVNWGYLKKGDVIDGLKWKNESKGIIDADSIVHLV